MPYTKKERRLLRMVSLLLKNRVMTETELMKKLGCNIGDLNDAYYGLFRYEIPIRRKNIYQKCIGRKTGRTKVNHRIIIYYLE